MPHLQKDPRYNEPVNIDMEPEEALKIVLQIEPEDTVEPQKKSSDDTLKSTSSSSSY